MPMRITSELLIGLFMGFFVHSLVNRPEPVIYTAHSPMGSVSEWNQPDCKVIFLNSGSEIRCSLNGKKAPREVFLTGKAWLQVEKKTSFISAYNILRHTGSRNPF
jgi:hypothetical protein